MSAVDFALFVYMQNLDCFKCHFIENEFILLFWKFKLHIQASFYKQKVQNVS